VVRLPQAPPLGKLAALGVSPASSGLLIRRDAMASFEDQLASLRG
jgi:hypothetical protein